MPSSITHQLIAEEALSGFPSKLIQIVTSAPDEFFLGAQGPDMLFFYKISNQNEFNFGRYLHRYRIYDVFCFFSRMLKQERSDTAIPRFQGDEIKQAYAYILGYLTHYAADNTFHPFVYRYLEKHNAKKLVHQQIENDWDVYFVRKLRQREAEYFPFAFSAETIIRHQTVARIFACLASNLGREEVNLKHIDRAIKNFSRYLKFFHGQCYKRGHSLTKAEELLRTKNYLSAFYPRQTPEQAFLSGEDYSDLSGGRGKNADELFARAVEKSKHYAKLFSKSVKRNTPLDQNEFGLGLLTGEK